MKLIMIVLCLFCYTASANPDVIIIGAGVSGTTAARTLADKGLKVKVIESRSRKGGRIFSDSTIFNYMIDFGAAWIHGSEGNEVYKMAIENKVDLVRFNFDDSKYYSISTSVDEDTDDKYYKIGKCFKNYITNYVAKLKANDDCTIAVVLSEYIKNVPQKDLDLTQLYLNNYLAWEFEGDYASKIEVLSAKEYDLKAKKGGDFLIPAGYWAIFKNQSVHENIVYVYNSMVIEVNQEGNNPYVLLKDNSKHYAKFILVTVPLGVLKKNVIKFTPQLEDSKLAAIDKMGFGTLEKIVVEFTKAFWGEDKSLIKLLEKSVKFLGYSVNLKKIINKTTLIFLVSGDEKYYPDYYTATDEEIKKQITSTLSVYFPADTEISITKIYRTKWRDDPNSYGSYSSYSVNSSSDSVKELAKDFGKVYFAGEHTSENNLETVVGAFESGKRAANSILQKFISSKRYLKK